MERTAPAIASALEDFIRQRFQIREGDTAFSRGVDLWDDGYVDSTGVVEMIVFLEESFALTLPEAVLFSPEFRNIDGIARLVAAL